MKKARTCKRFWWNCCLHLYQTSRRIQISTAVRTLNLTTLDADRWVKQISRLSYTSKVINQALYLACLKYTETLKLLHKFRIFSNKERPPDKCLYPSEKPSCLSRRTNSHLANKRLILHKTLFITIILRSADREIKRTIYFSLWNERSRNVLTARWTHVASCNNEEPICPLLRTGSWHCVAEK